MHFKHRVAKVYIFGKLRSQAFQKHQNHPHRWYESKVMASLIWNLLQRSALAKNATYSTSFTVIASNLVYRLVNSVESDCSARILISFFFQGISMVEVQHRVLWDSTQDISWKKKDIKILSLESNSTLLTSLQTKFEAITPKDVERVAFLAKAVRRKRFQIKEAITFESYDLWGWFWCFWKACGQSFPKIYTLPPCDP